MNEGFKRALGLGRPRMTLLIIVCGVAVHFAFPRYVIATGSMAPAIPPGSYVIASRRALIPLPLEKNDVAVFKPVGGVSPVPWIHRIVAVAGEKLSPPKRKGRVDLASAGPVAKGPPQPEMLVVPEAHFYQSGDAENSYHGLVSEDLVLGKVLFHFQLPWK